MKHFACIITLNLDFCCIMDLYSWLSQYPNRQNFGPLFRRQYVDWNWVIDSDNTLDVLVLHINE